MSHIPHDPDTVEDASIRRLDRRLQQANERWWSHVNAWAEVMDALGWCVALKTPAGGVYLSPNASKYLTDETAWEHIVSKIAKLSQAHWRVNNEDVQVWAHMEPAPKSAETFAKLTRRETDVLGWLREGKTGPEIAMILRCGQRTVESHVSQLYRKLRVHNRTQVVLSSVMSLRAKE